MKVLYFHQHFSTPAGSTGIRSWEMSKRLIAEGHSVTMVCGSYGGGNTGLTQNFKNGLREGDVAGINVVEFDLAYSNTDSFIKRTISFLSFAARSVKLALTRDYDVLFATTTPLTAGIPGIAARLLRRKPFVFEVRDLWPELPRAMGVITNPIILAMMSVLEWASYRSATRLVGLSPGIVDGIEKSGVKPDRITMIPNGCDLALFAEPETPWRPEGVAASDLMAVFAGTHGIANGLDAALNAAAVLKERKRQDIKIVLIGDGKLKGELQQRAAREGLDKVIFVDPVNKASLAGLLMETDLGLQLLANIPAFYFGTSPNKFFDYLAAGVPTLNNYPGWLAEMIGQHDCGYAVAPDNPAAFADALEHAADNRSQLAIKASNTKPLAASFDRQLWSGRWVEWVTGAK